MLYFKARVKTVRAHDILAPKPAVCYSQRIERITIYTLQRLCSCDGSIERGFDKRSNSSRSAGIGFLDALLVPAPILLGISVKKGIAGCRANHDSVAGRIQRSH